MRSLIRILVVLVLAIASTQWANATHIIGGDISYNYLGNNQYEIQLKIYRDCATGNAPFDNPAYVLVYEQIDSINGVYEETLYNFPLPDIIVLPEVPNSVCFEQLPDVCVEMAVYRDIITLEDNGNPYYIVHQRCCRNTLIDNIVNPDEAGSTFYTRIEPNVLDGTYQNSSPTFDPISTAFICLGEVYNFSLLAQEETPDNVDDYVEYSLYQPLDYTADNNRPNGDIPPPYDATITWANGYGTDMQLGPGSTFTVTPDGQVVLNPNTAGHFLLGFQAIERRVGTNEILSITRKEIQLVVENCLITSAEFFPQNGYCDDTSVELINESTFFDSIIWTPDLVNAPNETFTEETIVYDYNDFGEYTAQLIAKRGECIDTVQKQINIYDLEILDDALELIPDSLFFCTEGESVFLNPEFQSILYPDYEWSTIGENGDETLVSTEPNPLVLVTESIDYTVDLLGLGEECELEDTVHLFLNLLNLEVNLISAPCDSIGILQASSDQDGVSYSWFNNMGVPLGNGDTLNFIHSLSGTSNFTLIGLDESGCSDTLYISIPS